MYGFNDDTETTRSFMWNQETKRNRESHRSAAGVRDDTFGRRYFCSIKEGAGFVYLFNTQQNALSPVCVLVFLQHSVVLSFSSPLCELHRFQQYIETNPFSPDSRVGVDSSSVVSVMCFFVVVFCRSLTNLGNLTLKQQKYDFLAPRWSES